MKAPLSTVTIGAALGLLGLATIAAAAPTTERESSSGGFWRSIFSWGSQPSEAAKPAKIQYAAKEKREAKRPAGPPDSAAIGQAVREYLANNKDALRAAIVDLLNNDADVKKLLSGSGEKSAQAPMSKPADAQTPAAPTTDQARIEEIIRNYLVLHPEVLQEAIAELEKRQAQAEAERHRTAVTQNAELLYNSPRQVVLGNPQGDVTFVEFFDYNCAYCKRALGDMMELMKTDPKLKVVLKEFPVLGPGSVEAAQVATAVRMQDKTGKKYLEFHQKLLSGRGQADKARALAAAKEAGIDMARLEKDLASEEAKASIEESLKLAESLGLNGTPSYVVGPNVVIGAVGVAALREKVNTARCGKSSC